MKNADDIFIGSDNAVYLRGLKADNATAFDNAATLTLSLHTSEANAQANTSPVSGASAISMSYVTGSNGVYRGVLPYTLTLTSGNRYWIGIAIVGTAGRDRRVQDYVARSHGKR